MEKNILFDRIKKYHFEFKHLTVLFVGLILFQFILSFIHKASMHNFFDNTQEWYQRNSAERLANMNTTTIELLYEIVKLREDMGAEERRHIIQFFDMILNQQILHQNIEEICLLVNRGSEIVAIDNGNALFANLIDNTNPTYNSLSHKNAIELYRQIYDTISSSEQIINLTTNNKTYHIFVPFVPNGEFAGALYIKNTPDFTFVQREMITSYEETSLIYSALFLLGLLAMYYISTYTVKERDEAQKLLLEEHEQNIKQQIEHQKESMFTKRIYHTHHKAEKIMGFIKEDLRNLSVANIDEIKNRVLKYSNFVSRVIYDMKWYEPPLQTVRNPTFRTNINEVIRFIVENIFNRTARKTGSFKIELDLDQNVPPVHINEFVVWEIIEPLIQNSVDHGGDDFLNIKVSTQFDAGAKSTTITIEDDGAGIKPELLETDENGVKKLFLEKVSTKKISHTNSGYGCYIAYELSVQRCGWKIDAENLPSKGCKFTILVPH
ncbi:sensor histidine kinase [Melioribacter sp. Ez-97]|uniref:sensor histidine kinase n=1 Tax=Melioribacter sp. Ez-97 TaxID=3423434 RepID=UPI003ED91CCC